MFGVSDAAEERPATAGHVATRRLDLDDVGSKVRQILGGKRRRNALAVLDHTDGGQRSRNFGAGIGIGIT